MSNNIEINKWDTTEFLENQADIDAYLQVAFESGDPRQISKALGNAAKAHGMLDIAGKTEMVFMSQGT